MKCKDCEHWQFDKEDSMDRGSYICKPIDPDTYEYMKLPFEMRICKSPKLLFHERANTPDGCTIIDASQYFAKLITGEDFGCVNFEPKEA